MSDEAALLTHVRTRPDDATAKLVYADWLDERGDPRAAVIRAAERLNTLSVLTTEYWEAKAARTELFATADAEWLDALGYARRYRPMFTTLPADRGSRWRLLDRFVDVWRNPLRATEGFGETEIARPKRGSSSRSPRRCGSFTPSSESARTCSRAKTGSLTLRTCESKTTG